MLLDKRTVEIQLMTSNPEEIDSLTDCFLNLNE